MSDIFKQEIACDNCGIEFSRQDLKRFRNHLYCQNCLQEIKSAAKGKERGGGDKGGKTQIDEGMVSELQETKKQIATLEGKLTELDGALSKISAGATSAAQDIAGALKTIAEQLKHVTESPPPATQEPLDATAEETPAAEPSASKAPPLPSPEFQMPLEADVRDLAHTPAIINWGLVIDLAIKCGWHRSYHVYLAFLRAIDREYGAVLSQEYKGKPGTLDPLLKTPPQPPSLYDTWVSTVATHVPLLQAKRLQWRDFVVPTGTGETRNAHAKQQQKVLDYLIAHQNAPTSSREIADALLPSFESTSNEGVRRRMLQNVVATLTRRGILALKSPEGFPKLFWIPDCRQ